jgi:SAM-dependent methyltransferase
MSRFDKDALRWDDLPRRVNLAKAVVKHIKPHLTGKEKVLEFGCGTGLVGLNLADKTKSLIGIDTSKEMVKKFNEKAKKLEIRNAKAFQKNIFDLEEKFDAAISSMTLHHIKDIKSLSKKLYEISDICFLADLCKENGSFHTRGNHDVYHFGFARKELEEYFSEWKIDFKIIHLIKKHKHFPVFLITLYK